MYEYCPMGIDWEFDEYVSFGGELFEKLLTLVFERADAFSLTVCRWLDQKDNGLEKALRPFKIDQYRTPVWYGYYAAGMELSDLPVKDINMYQANDDTKRILLDHMDDLFLNKMENGNLMEQELSVEDINFFTNGTWILGTVSHEMMATLYDTDNLFTELLQQIGNWKDMGDTAPLRISDFI